MTTVSNISASPGFHKHFDPVTSMQKNLERALAANQLEIWLMGSRPPTREECEMGYQWLEAGTDDLPAQSGPNPRTPQFGGTYRPETQSLAVLGVYRLNGADWAHLRELIPGLSGTVLSIIPQLVLDDSSAAPQVWLDAVNSSYYRTTQFVSEYESSPWYPRWALLRSRAVTEPAAQQLAHAEDQRWASTARGHAISKVLFDFRGGIPLSVGPRDSNANLRLGLMDTAGGSYRIFNNYRQISRHRGIFAFSLHVPAPTALSTQP